MYSISWMYGHDYQKVAKWNHLKAPFVIKKGQRLRVAGLSNDPVEHHRSAVGTYSNREPVRKRRSSKSVNKIDVTRYSRVSKNSQDSTDRKLRKTTLKWQWPTHTGKLIQSFNSRDPGKRGLDISGKSGQAVFSASAGRVVYSGSGLPRYGKLIIVKHSDVYLSAYAHNQTLRVKQGEKVKSGQHIADMGSSGTSRTKLHFEIRRNGKAVDPLRLLPKPRPVK